MSVGVTTDQKQNKQILTFVRSFSVIHLGIFW